MGGVAVCGALNNVHLARHVPCSVVVWDQVAGAQEKDAQARVNTLPVLDIVGLEQVVMILAVEDAQRRVVSHVMGCVLRMLGHLAVLFVLCAQRG